MKRYAWKLCVVLGVSVVCLSSADDTLPLGKKTQGSATNPDTLVSPKASGKEAAPKKDKGEAPQTGRAFVGAVDIFGTDRVTEEDLKELFGKDLDKWIELGMKNDPKALEMQNQLAEKAKKKWGFVFADWTLANFVTPDGLAVYLTLDVVEKKDAARRMAFLPEPAGSYTDPDNLIQQWRKYEETALRLVQEAQLVPDTEKCVAWHCPFGHRNPKLRPFEKIFVEGVKKHHKELSAILKGERRPDLRSAAAFLLAYYPNGQEVAAAMVDRIPDPDPIVRNNVLRVLGHFAQFHREINFPLAPVLRALEYPRVSDRSKAIVVAFQMADASAAARDLIRQTSVPILLELLACKQPDQREIAHNILRKISGREFSVDDEKSWKLWYRSLPKDGSLSRK